MKFNLDNKKIIDENKIGNFFLNLKKKKKLIVHCHGVFDLVHPGHIRHFLYCKKLADVLVVSLTSDKYIKKGIYRPLVPENLRAINLAFLELVDFVIINRSPRPYSLLKKIKPDFFAKGIEYLTQSSKKHLTNKEKEIVEKNKGKVVFTPGDFVSSSTQIINNSNPDLKYEKLKLLLDTENYSFKNIKNILKDINQLKVTVIGDTIVDSISDCKVIGGLHKTPTLSVQVTNRQDYLGGAAIVAAHFKSLTNNVKFISLVGNDKHGRFVKEQLNKLNIQHHLITENNRPTVNKNSLISQKHKLIKIDTVDNSYINDETIENITKILSKVDSDIIVFSDFRHGIFNKFSLKKILKIKNLKKKFLVADSQVATRWGNILDFKNFDLITPTETEARLALFEQDLGIRPLATKLLKYSSSKNLILKLGEKGLISLSKIKEEDYISLEPFVKELVDASGAGDAMLAYSSSILFKTKSLILASVVGTIAASCKCEVKGNQPIKLDQVFKKIDEIENFF
jgi:rfaE bifunctional protein kinase chain/domain